MSNVAMLCEGARQGLLNAPGQTRLTQLNPLMHGINSILQLSLQQNTI